MSDRLVLRRDYTSLVITVPTPKEPPSTYGKGETVVDMGYVGKEERSEVPSGLDPSKGL